MKGSYSVLVRNRRIQYKFTIERNITILKGDSATGKTTLIEMIAEYNSRGEDSGITLLCDRPCVVLNSLNWKLILENTYNSIVFIDEGDVFVKSDEFAELVKRSDNYFVIATRAKLSNLPYSVMEVYGIKNTAGNKYQGTKRLYSEFYPIYSNHIPQIEKPDCIIVEDSNSGYEFFSSVCALNNIACIHAGGNANVEAMVASCNYNRILVIVDGAAFGPYIERLLDMSLVKQLGIYLPESFEWLILKSNLLNDADIQEILKAPEDYIESEKYFSWERFFTALLSEKSKNTYLAYNKRALNAVYLQNYEKREILKSTPLEVLSD